MLSDDEAHATVAPRQWRPLPDPPGGCDLCIPEHKGRILPPDQVIRIVTDRTSTSEVYIPINDTRRSRALLLEVQRRMGWGAGGADYCDYDGVS